MKLLIISNMAHYKVDDFIVGWGPTVEEINYLSGLFSEICHIACLHDDEAPPSSLPYQAKNIRMVFVPPAGGANWGDKLGILRLFPKYARIILREIPLADVVHIRAPANISLLAMILLAIKKYPEIRWIKYQNNWMPKVREAGSYTFQRWWLRHNFARSLVTVNGEWSGQPSHIHSFLNPCLNEEERKHACLEAQPKCLGKEVRLLFAGRVENAKGIGTTLEIVRQLHQDGIKATLEIAGDGPEKAHFEQMAKKLNIDEFVCFRGWVAHPEMASLYKSAHIILLPTTASEGWPKVLGEAMAHGVVPIASDISSIGQYLRRFSTGQAVSPGRTELFTESVKFYLKHPDTWRKHSQEGIRAAKNFTYERYCERIRSLLGLAPVANLSAKSELLIP